MGGVDGLRGGGGDSPGIYCYCSSGISPDDIGYLVPKGEGVGIAAFQQRDSYYAALRSFVEAGCWVAVDAVSVDGVRRAVVLCPGKNAVAVVEYDGFETAVMWQPATYRCLKEVRKVVRSYFDRLALASSLGEEEAASTAEAAVRHFEERLERDFPDSLGVATTGCPDLTTQMFTVAAIPGPMTCDPQFEDALWSIVRDTD